MKLSKEEAFKKRKHQAYQNRVTVLDELLDVIAEIKLEECKKGSGAIQIQQNTAEAELKMFQQPKQ